MNIDKLLKSVVELDEMAVVICDTEHTIVYMNRAAIKKYEKRGGAVLIGKNLLDCHNEHSRIIIKGILEKFKQDKTLNKIYTYSKTDVNQDVYMVALRDENDELIGYYEKFESRIPHSAN